MCFHVPKIRISCTADRDEVFDVRWSDDGYPLFFDSRGAPTGFPEADAGVLSFLWHILWLM